MKRLRGRRLPPPVLLAALSCSACTGYIQSSGRSEDPRRPDASGAASDGDARAPTPNDGTLEETLPTVDPASCNLDLPVSPLRRLSRSELSTTIHAAFPGVDLTSLTLPSDGVVGVFTSQLAAVGEAELSAYVDCAAHVADHAAADLRQTLGACADSGAPDSSCVGDWLGRTAAILWRRPLDEVEKQRLLATLYEPAATASASAGVATLTERLLLSPRFMYVVAPGVGDAPGLRPLDAHEAAEKLSYTLLRSPPTPAILQAAANGSILDENSRRELARHTLSEDNAANVAWAFVRDLFGLSDSQSKDVAEFPGFSQALSHSMLESAARLTRRAFSAEGLSFVNLLLSDRAEVDDHLAPLYGLTPASSGWQEVTLPPGSERRGILAQAAFLSSHAGASEPSVVRRGLSVARGLLCRSVPPPPPTVNMDSSVDRLSEPLCSGCHSVMDPIGYAFEAFDAIGAYRPERVSSEASARAALVGSAEQDGPVGNPQDLALRLTASASLPACLGEQTLRFAEGRALRAEDACRAAKLGAELAATNSNWRDALVALVASPTFVQTKLDAPGGHCP